MHTDNEPTRFVGSLLVHSRYTIGRQRTNLFGSLSVKKSESCESILRLDKTCSDTLVDSDIPVSLKMDELGKCLV